MTSTSPPASRTARVIDPAQVASSFREEVRREIRGLSEQLAEPLVIAGFLAADHGPSATYAEYTRKGCEDVGARFDLRHVKRLEAEEAIAEANRDPAVHGILVYYPVFGLGTEQDVYLRDRVDPGKDIEGLHSFWAQCLYANRRFLDEAKTKKSILPCTPLAVLKLLDEAGASRRGQARPLAGVRAVVFNRSEVVGRPLASMMANDGAEVLSFDIDGAQRFAPAPEEGAHSVEESTVTRAEALAQADVVVTGVPSRTFPLVRAAEIREGAICLNFSTLKNFDEDVLGKAGVFVPRVGPMTVTMAVRNAVRLRRNALV
ncbi:MAG TPA: bifunctional methylenetetrahydrofolate dehydrogenase/methenyltetrahydrofolate cyclohydrolase [Polyangiaceae bacterium]|jgi:methylenetetrahydrofolate dehydrogenase (NADP+)/methenyltetrahydrofolate cyclohydrolase